MEQVVKAMSADISLKYYHKCPFNTSPGTQCVNESAEQFWSVIILEFPLTDSAGATSIEFVSESTHYWYIPNTEEITLHGKPEFSHSKPHRRIIVSTRSLNQEHTDTLIVKTMWKKQ